MLGDQIEWWVKMGATQEEVAEKLHISSESLWVYLRKGEQGDERYAALSAAFARARSRTTWTVF